MQYFFCTALVSREELLFEFQFLCQFMLNFNFCESKYVFLLLTLNLPTTTIVAQPFNVIKWQLKFNPVA